MNIYITRIIILLIVTILLVIISKKSSIIKKYFKKIYIFIILIIILSLLIAPEQYFLKYKNLKSAFNYSVPYKKILTTIEEKNYGFVIFEESDYKYIKYFKSNKNKWNVASPIITSSWIHKSNYKISIKKINGTNNYFIYIDSPNIEETEISDNCNSIFKEIKDSNRSKDYYIYIEDKPQDYYILLNHEKIEF